MPSQWEPYGHLFLPKCSPGPSKMTSGKYFKTEQCFGASIGTQVTNMEPKWSQKGEANE